MLALRLLEVSEYAEPFLWEYIWGAY